MAKLAPQRYLASDNTEFATAAEADAHDAFLRDEVAIEAYITFADLKLAQAGLMRRHLSGWEAFKASDDFQAQVDATAERIAAAKEEAKKKAAEEKAAKKAAAQAEGSTEGSAEA